MFNWQIEKRDHAVLADEHNIKNMLFLLPCYQALEPFDSDLYAQCADTGTNLGAGCVRLRPDNVWLGISCLEVDFFDPCYL
ncbi:hypothetical protein MGG_16931 [Pyricularia oryzae 70-15]|uniref:Uncharacterized protein n=1 Tax=Pyricularia oryzae (strain 70-15 / ATCC MYA-4617 / FGSC 8958) TaxID=242507 RepID=G4N133_PYRO7|nr:uncharacterized protein MGG_16931 [Pyricularia oryzae 70-15]EHA53209.1 hypothetical protein MGG_16931 [Pyricularia oryzae 70-15]